MNYQQMKKAFDEWEDVVDLRRIEKVGNPIEKIEAKSKLKHFWYVWERCWPLAIKSWREDQDISGPDN